MARLDRRLRVSWETLKTLANQKRVGYHSYETENAIEVYLIEDGEPSFWACVYKSTDPSYDVDTYNDWIDNYALTANGPSRPRDYDGRDVFLPVTLGAGQWHYWHGEGDDVEEETIGGGAAFAVSRSTAGESTVVWRYRDPVWIAGGSFKYEGAQLGDWVRFEIYAPATPITPSAGGNTGNCNLHESGVLIPAAGDGAYNVDLENTYPVPTSDFAPYSGFWNYALPADMKGKGVTTAGTPGGSKYHLIPARVNLDLFVNKERLLGSGLSTYEPQNIRVSLCLPGWEFECTIHNETGDHTLEAIWRVLVSRYWTTV
jgi:hypothetical protein